MRSTPEWIGKTDDTPIPDRVRIRVFEAHGGRCHSCRRTITAGERWTCEHVQAICNGGENRESNLDVTCAWCLPGKNAADVKIKAKSYAVRKRHVGVRKPRTITRWRKFSGEIVIAERQR
jgi:hypothetical protein